MSLTLISATPSPFARINRIALLEKGIPFELQEEIPWHKSETQTPKYNPLEKLPVLLFPDNRKPVYDSAHIQNYIILKYADKGPKLITGDIDTDLELQQIQVLSEGVMDAFVLANFEKRRENKSQAWLERQERKIGGGLRAMDELAKNRAKGSDFLFNDTLTIADIAVGCTCGFVNFSVENGGFDKGWEKKYPDLVDYWKKLEELDSFKKTVPKNFDLRSDEVV